MSVNKYKIALPTISGATNTYFEIPIEMDFQMVDQTDIINRDFVAVEREKSINPIVDYGKTSFLPIDSTNTILNTLKYTLNIFDDNKVYQNTYGSIGFDRDDLFFSKKGLTESRLVLNFYDSDNPNNNNLLFTNTLYPNNLPYDGDINNINIEFTPQNPITKPQGNAEGFKIYWYKNDVSLTQTTDLYVTATFINSKSGVSKRLMVVNTPLDVTQIIDNIFFKVTLSRDNEGFYFIYDNNYSNNVTFNNDEVITELWDIDVL